MSLYWHVFRFSLARYRVYPLEFLFSVLQRIATLGFLIIFWSIIIADAREPIDIRNLASYFLIADGLSGFTAHYTTILGRYLRRNVKYGTISGYFLRPISIISYMHAASHGKHAAEFILGGLFIIAGIAIAPPASSASGISFVIAALSACVIGFSLNLLEGSLAFLFTEVTGFKNALRHISRIASGLIIPLSFFPDHTRMLLELTPFPYIIYYPVSMLQSETIMWQPLLIGIGWALFGVSVTYLLWRNVRRSYEAVGI